MSTKTCQTASHKIKDRISERSRRGMRDVSLHNHAQVMRDAKRLREQIRVRAVNAEYAQLNQALGLRRQSKALPKISKQQTLKSCIAHIKLLRTELSKVIDEQDSDSDQLRDAETIPILPRPLFMPTFPLYIPSLHYMPEVAMESDNTRDNDVTTFPYIQPYLDNEYDTGMRASPEEDSSLSDVQNNSDTFDSDLSADFPNYDSFCSTPESASSSFSWFISSDWGNLEDN